MAEVQGESAKATTEDITDVSDYYNHLANLVDHLAQKQAKRFSTIKQLMAKHEASVADDFEQLVLDMERLMQTTAGSRNIREDAQEMQRAWEKQKTFGFNSERKQEPKMKSFKEVKATPNSLIARYLQDGLHQEDHDEPSGGVELLRYKLRKYTSHPYFDYFVGFAIAANAILIGVETELSLKGGDLTWIHALENFFLVFYTCEVILKLFARSLGAFKDNWFRFDFVCIILGLLATVLSVYKEEGTTAWWEQIMLVRVFRLLRLLRAFRMMLFFRTMWTLVYGLFESMETIASTFGLLLVTLFMFACAGIDMITKDEYVATHELTAEIVAFNFGDMGRTILTLMQFVTCDSIASIYMPLVVVKPQLAAYFVTALVFISISLMNLVTATLVEGALNTAQDMKLAEDKATKQKMRRLLPTIMEVFRNVDVDGSGELTLEEMEHVHLKHLPKEFKEKVSVENMKDMFEILDVDGTGKLSEAEFVEGLISIALMEVPLSTVQLLKQVKLTHSHVIHVEGEVNRIKSLFD
eukprot:TRINITY_DN1874_c0_g2_i3.p1 TRINITY_DN1874_c0_g2~~TRINITY_DN1874_c0_g2_i3.p1  ORF type:complete len:553 (+),score=97.54 TRINITY_DN1874_c0_g2_i3:86-1660(+)